MRNNTIFMCSALVLVFLISSCKPKVDIKTEEEAIKTVINEETQAWIDKDVEKQKGYFIHDAYQTRVNIQDSVYFITTGWDKRSTEIDTVTKYVDWVGVDQFKIQKEFLVTKVMGNTAWTIFRETQTMTYYGSPATSVSLIYVVLEKIDNDWKISCFLKSFI